jgi:hypothetical protein
MKRGFNYETAVEVRNELERLKDTYTDIWSGIPIEKYNEIITNHSFQDVRLEVDQKYSSIKNLPSVITQVNKLIEDLFRIELQQELTDSELDQIIYEEYDEYISVCPSIYGRLSSKEINYKRALIRKSLEFYKSKS